MATNVASDSGSDSESSFACSNVDDSDDEAAASAAPAPARKKRKTTVISSSDSDSSEAAASSGEDGDDDLDGDVAAADAKCSLLDSELADLRETLQSGDGAGAGGSDGAGAGAVDDGEGAGAASDGAGAGGTDDGAGAAGDGAGAGAAGDGAEAGAASDDAEATGDDAGAGDAGDDAGAKLTFQSENEQLKQCSMLERLLFVNFRQPPPPNTGFGESSMEWLSAGQIAALPELSIDEDKFKPVNVSSVSTGLHTGRFHFCERLNFKRSRHLRDLAPYLYFNVKEGVKAGGLGAEHFVDSPAIAEQVQLDLLTVTHALFPAFAEQFPFKTVKQFLALVRPDSWRMTDHIVDHFKKEDLRFQNFAISCGRGRSRSFAVMCHLNSLLHFAMGHKFLRSNINPNLDIDVFWQKRRSPETAKWFSDFRLTCHYALDRRGETDVGRGDGLYADRNDR